MINRPRRLRLNKNMRSLVCENKLSVNDLIYPLFVVEGEKIKSEIPNMPDVFHFSVDVLQAEINEIYNLGIKAVIIFGIPSFKDSCGNSAFDENGIVQKAVREIKKINSDIIVITDVCMCQYTDHGHCGLLDKFGKVENDKTLKVLSKIAVSHANAGADIVAPSDMMDGRILAIRNVLDKNGFEDVSIMAYSAKYASNFYSPFRAAAKSSPNFSDRKSYQMDYHNSNEALKEMKLDVCEGADFLMVKPALSYLDIIKLGKDNFNLPMVAYNVSGEYAMIKCAIANGVLDEMGIYESVISIKRAGADLIITYFAKYLAEQIKQNKFDF